MKALLLAAAVAAALALGWFISMIAAYEDFTFVPGPLIVAAGLFMLLRRRGETARTAAADAVAVIVISCAIAAGSIALLDAFGDAVGEAD